MSSVPSSAPCSAKHRRTGPIPATAARAEVLPTARKDYWDDDRIAREVAQPDTNFTPELVRRVLQAKRSEFGSTLWEQGSRQFGQDYERLSDSSLDLEKTYSGNHLNRIGS